ncbi:hypothetical protein PG299_02755 [Riemerella anatipestifer]|nr:hypothetical protein [Riemerella anatipestifer]
MKILRYIFALPAGILGSILISMIMGFFWRLFKIPFAKDWGEMFIAGSSLIVITNFVAPAKRKLFLILSSIVALSAFIVNKIYLDNYEFVFLIGAISGVVSLLSSKEELMADE